MGEVEPVAYSVSSSVVVGASASEVFDLIRRPRRHSEFDGSGTLRMVTSGPELLEEDSTFVMGMRYGIPYRIHNRVVEFHLDQLIAWRHFGKHRWRYQLEQVGGGCRITETFDYSAGPVWFYRFFRIPQRNLANIEASLERLVEMLPLVEGSDSGLG